MSFVYSEMDQLILKRWSDVVGLIEAHKETQDRMEEMITLTGERLDRWARPLGYEVDTDLKEPEFQFWRLAWSDKRRGPKVKMTLGGFCPIGYRRTEHKHPYLWLYTETLENFRVKEAERIALAHSLRTALGDDAKHWDADGVDDASSPLGRYLSQVGDVERARIHIRSRTSL